MFGLRQPEALAKQIRALRCRLRPQRVPHRAPSFRPHSPRAASAIGLFTSPRPPPPITVSITTPSPLPPQPLALRHHPATIQPAGPQQCAAGGSRDAGTHRGTTQKGSGDVRHCSEGRKGCVHPSWAARPLHLLAGGHTACCPLPHAQVCTSYTLQLAWWHISLLSTRPDGDNDLEMGSTCQGTGQTMQWQDRRAAQVRTIYVLRI